MTTKLNARDDTSLAKKSSDVEEDRRWDTRRQQGTGVLSSRRPDLGCADSSLSPIP